MKNKTFNFQKLLIWGGIPSALIAFLTALAVISKSFTAYADAPKNIDKLTEVMQKVEKTQARQEVMLEFIMNKEMQADKEAPPKDDEPILSPDGKFQWNEVSQKWERVK